MAGERATKKQRESLEMNCRKWQMNLSIAGPYLAGRGFSEETAVAARLGVVDGDHDHYAGRLSIPYLTRAGVVGHRFRCIEQHDCKEPGTGRRHQKYLGYPGAVPRLYGVLDLLGRAGRGGSTRIAVTEGELDRLTLTECGIPAVGFPGAAVWQPFYERLFEGYEEIVVFTDGDEEGERFGAKLAERIRRVRIAPMDAGQDVNSAFVKYGGEYLAERFERIA